jgi:hypothetical protein
VGLGASKGVNLPDDGAGCGHHPGELADPSGE